MATPEDPESSFRDDGRFRRRNGPAWAERAVCCNKKLCFTATDKAALIQVLHELSLAEDCVFVKYTREPHDGMYLGRCFMRTEERIGLLWAEYKLHPKFMCNVQDDDFTERFRERVRVWS